MFWTMRDHEHPCLGYHDEQQVVLLSHWSGEHGTAAQLNDIMALLKLVNLR